MTIKAQIQEELKRYLEINKYTTELLNEQVVPPDQEEKLPTEPGAESGTPPAAPAPLEPPPGGAPDTGGIPSASDAGGTPPEGDLPPIGDVPPKDGDLGGDDTTEEIYITDLVNMTKNIKQQLDAKTNDDSGTIQKMNDVFAKLDDLSAKLGEMDSVIAKIDELGAKVEQMKPPTPVEKLEMRSLDSYPFNQNPTDFFNQKQGEMRASGKNEYVLTKDDVENYAKNEIVNSFNKPAEEDQEYKDVKF
jgi:polyhydroxyalkanoate synthesis regulator phasin